MKPSSLKFGGIFDPAAKRQQLQEIDHQISSDPDFWLNQQKSAPALKSKKSLENSIKSAGDLKQLKEDCEAALELVKEGADEYLEEAYSSITLLEEKIKQIEILNILSHPQDTSPAIVTINAGAGGTESCDWADMVLRMYLRYSEKKGWKVDVVDLLTGDEAGVKSATIEVSGEFAHGFLKAESGVHRLVRISPFDSNARRHTSFCSVFVTPLIDDDIEISVNPADLKIDTYRASGAGGQHINKTDSAVRITHQPSGIVVQCQNQRSQHQNKDKALKILKSKLYEQEVQKRANSVQEEENSKTDISFGHQIRSYVLHPYKLVKDHRTEEESHAPLDILDGQLDELIQSYLQMLKAKS